MSTTSSESVASRCLACPAKPTISDYQSAKQMYRETGKVAPKFQKEDLDRGFLVTGLWSWSRHPNFVAEQAVWVVLYQWSCWVTQTYFNWSVVGAISYLILFQASTWFTELITTKKYPEYKEYQQMVGKFLPTSLPSAFGGTSVSEPGAGGEVSKERSN